MKVLLCISESTYNCNFFVESVYRAVLNTVDACRFGSVVSIPAFEYVEVEKAGVSIINLRIWTPASKIVN